MVFDVWLMKTNQLLQGFLILLIATGMVLFMEEITGGDKMNLNDIPAWTAVDTVIPEMQEIYTDNSLEGEEAWEKTGEIEANPQTNQSPLSHFLTALDQVKSNKGKARIAYFGDSMIEGDLITQSLRHDLQELFGGEGVGFVPITSQTYGFRQSIKHRFSSDWQQYNFLTPNPTKHEFGISGEIFLTQGSAANMPGKTWVKYWGEDLYPTTEVFHKIKLFYGKQKSEKPKNNFVLVTLNEHKDTIRLDRTSLVNEVAIASQQTDEI